MREATLKPVGSKRLTPPPFGKIAFSLLLCDALLCQ
jgi:hypothetical protein